MGDECGSIDMLNCIIYGFNVNHIVYEINSGMSALNLFALNPCEIYPINILVIKHFNN